MKTNKRHSPSQQKGMMMKNQEQITAINLQMAKEGKVELLVVEPRTFGFPCQCSKPKAMDLSFLLLLPFQWSHLDSDGMIYLVLIDLTWSSSPRSSIFIAVSCSQLSFINNTRQLYQSPLIKSAWRCTPVFLGWKQQSLSVSGCTCTSQYPLSRSMVGQGGIHWRSC